MVELLIGLTASLDEYTDSSFCVHKAWIEPLKYLVMW